MNTRPEEDDARLPWLEGLKVEDFPEPEEPERPPFRLRRWLLLLALVCLVAVVGTMGWRRGRAPLGSGGGRLIEAPAGDYKVKPDDPGGLQVDGDAAFSTGSGAQTNGTLDLGKKPEDPVAGSRAPTARSAPPAAKVVAKVPDSGGTLAVPPPTAGSATMQLGAYPNEARAAVAWEQLTRRFTYLAPLGKNVVKAEVNGKTVYRLRVTAGSAAMAQTLCGRLKLANVPCYMAPPSP